MSFLKRFIKVVLFMAILAIPFLAWWQRYRIFDYWRLRGYVPPPAISALARTDSMTPKAQHYFYINRPLQVEQVAQFHSDCPDSEKSIVLGCYHGGQNGIFIYAVKDSRLAGVQQVTAAHEMLHAAYERLTSNDRQYVDNLTASYYATVKDQRIIDEINLYKKTEPKSVSDEMHSVFGTEIASLPSALANYYSQYFINRATVTSFAGGYQAEFTNRSNQINSDDAQLVQVRASITSQENSLSSLLGQLQSDRSRLDNLRSSGQIGAYNAAVYGFNAEVDNYNQKLSALQNDIDAYNQLVVSRNAIAVELRGLDSAIDTRLTSQHAK